MNASTDQPRKLKSVALSEAKFHSLFEAIPDAVLLTNADGNIVFANLRAGQLFGYSSGEFAGLRIENLLPERFRPAFAKHLQKHLSQSRNRPEAPGLEVSGRRKDGSEFPAEIYSCPLQTENGSQTVNTIRDLTDRHQIQKELEAKSAALETANQELQAFSYSISHDLRAPLRAMDGFGNMLKRALGANVSKEVEHPLNRIKENAARMSSLIDGLLDFSSLTWIAVTKKPVDPAKLARDVFEELKRSANGRQMEIEIGKLPGCTADPALLRLVFTHLLSNAIKYTRDRNPAIIRVDCAKENGENIFSVRDNGAGFDMEYSGKLFRIFQRLHSPADFDGTGVGLAIVQRIVQRHGGRIWGEGKTDHGATFYFTLGDSSHGNSA